MSPHRMAPLLALGIAIILALTACWSLDVRDDDFLFVEPCIPYPDSDVDPCERRLDWELGISGDFHLTTLPERPFDTYHEQKKRSARCPNGLCTPQFYVRATVIPGSARCAQSVATMWEEENGDIGPLVYRDGARVRMWDCFVDIAVHEYFNGTGPRQMPIKIKTIFLDAWKTRPDVIDDYARGVSWFYEGYELIIPLVRDLNLLRGEWSMLSNGLWDVQRTTDNQTIVVAWWTHHAPLEWWPDYEMTLDDFREMTRDGMARYYRETSGRLGTSGQNPLAATDAGRDGLLGMLRELGAYSVEDLTPEFAPPAPGVNDLFGPWQETIEPTATATPEVTDFATPTTMLDDAPTATADTLP